MTTIPIRLKGGTAQTWILKNPVLAPREPGVETDTHKWKIGDGETPWNLLPYMAGNSSGGGGGSDTYVHYQPSPSAEWLIQHNIGAIREPVILLASDPTHPVYTDVTYVNSDRMLLIFPEPVSGWAYV